VWYIDGQKNKYSVLNECNRMLKYNIQYMRREFKSPLLTELMCNDVKRNIMELQEVFGGECSACLARKPTASCSRYFCAINSRKFYFTWNRYYAGFVRCYGQVAMVTTVSTLGFMTQLTSNLRQQNNKTETSYGGLRVIQPDVFFVCV
jgi:hypothetical protein